MKSFILQFRNNPFYFTFLTCAILTLTCFPVTFVTTFELNPAVNHTAAVSTFTISSFCFKPYPLTWELSAIKRHRPHV